MTTERPCPQCGADLNFDPECAVIDPVKGAEGRDYRTTPAVLCNSCDYCAEETAYLANGKRLYWLSERADARLSEIIRARTDGRHDRWSVPAAVLIAHPDIREALREKLDADEAWLTYLRSGR